MERRPEEKYMEWLVREEEILGVDAIERATVDIEEARRLLYEELGYEPTDAQVTSFQGAGLLAFEKMPAVGVYFTREWHPEYQGYAPAYKDIMTGRYVSPKDVWAALAMY